MLNRFQAPTPVETITQLGYFLIHQRQEAATQGKPFHLVLAGGNTPRKLYTWLANHTTPAEWSNTHFYWGDERCVPPDHPDSNYRMVFQAWLHPWGHEHPHIHRLWGEAEPEDEAKRYQALLYKQLLPSAKFDMALLGLGEDGHTASLFPAYPELKSTPAWCVATQQPSSGQARLSLTPAILNQSRQIIFLVTGQEKAEIVAQVFGKESDYPANWVQAVQGNRWLFTDTAAGQEL